ncbi:uncharacterized protein LOC100485553 [Xenopus tropicalis]|uniref:Uncharacterized LOC100485553 n=1 Tax=Xenopus tropicalis TaxID=8364 RepID=A0A6I8RG75_XENTR|nr:uncharacterized protein LOC100485553 [Xenopus tropicalis]
MASLRQSWRKDGRQSEESKLQGEEKAKLPFVQKENPERGARPIRKLNLTKNYSDGMYAKYRVGSVNIKRAKKVIMMVGETGSGKTTLINALVNYILGVQFEDTYRYQLIEENTNISQAHSQTSEVVIYQLNHTGEFIVPYSLTIIDTPGFGDTRGLEQDELTVKKIEECFSSKWGIDRIDGIYFVVKSSSNRLTKSQNYVFQSILSLFGKDIKNNIQICATFSGQGKPGVLQALLEAEVPCVKKTNGDPEYFKFNNYGLCDKSDDDEEEEDEEYSQLVNKANWKMGKSSSKNMFRSLEKLTSRSLILTNKVLMERRQLEIVIEDLLSKIEKVDFKQKELERREQILKQHEEDIKRNENFEYEEHETVKERRDVEGNSINCHECMSTCHHPCLVSLDFIAGLCEVFYWNRSCKLCDHDVSCHFCESYKWEEVVISTKKTYAALKESYEKACNEKVTAGKVVDELKKEIQKLSSEQMQLLEKFVLCLQSLNAIALRPQNLSTVDYIDLLISAERCEAKTGFMERITSLEKAKVKAVALQLTATEI